MLHRGGGGHDAQGAPAALPARGHLPVSGPRGSLAELARHPEVRRIYTHLDNTNPLLDAGSAARTQVNEAGVEVLMDGAEFAV